MGSEKRAPSKSENYRLYRSTAHPRTYLVISTFYDRDRGGGEFPRRGFRRASLRRLGQEIASCSEVTSDDGKPVARVEITLRTHGYNTRFDDFASQVQDEADSNPETTLRPAGRFYIGYRWPSAGMGSSRSLLDTLGALNATWAISAMMIGLPVLAFVLQESGPHPLPSWLGALLGPYFIPLFAAIMLGVGIGLLMLRLSTYLSDRYRALHYGVPDLTEFIRDLDYHLYSTQTRAGFDLVGHSMGCLVLVNAVRIMTDFFHFPGDETHTLSRMASIELHSLVLCAADIPAALAAPGRNNYFLSSLRRFSSIHVLSSDRDFILKWASNLGNWASEPRFDMSSRRLGNTLLVHLKDAPRRLETTPLLGELLPVIRPSYSYSPIQSSPSPVREGARKSVLQFHDCSSCRSVGGDLGWATRVAVVAVLVGLGLWISPLGTIARWVAIWIWALFSLGAVCRWLQKRFVNNWYVGPALGLLADWPSTMAFRACVRNPHSGYFIRGDAPRLLVAQLIAASPDGQASEALSQAPPPIRSSALVIPV